jgi:hypothetical protein
MLACAPPAWPGRDIIIIIAAAIRAYDLEVFSCQICKEGSKSCVAARTQKISFIVVHAILGELHVEAEIASMQS